MEVHCRNTRLYKHNKLLHTQLCNCYFQLESAHKSSNNSRTVPKPVKIFFLRNRLC